MEAVLISIGAIVPMLLILVVVHEFGHYATARSLGVKVLEFGVGFPPRAFGFYTGRTRVLISPDTRFVNLDGMASLHTGQLVKVISSEDTAGNLVAQVIEVPTPGGAARVNVPAKTPNGRRLRLRGKGATRRSPGADPSRGDLYARLVAQLPDTEDPRLDELAR